MKEWHGEKTFGICDFDDCPYLLVKNKNPLDTFCGFHLEKCYIDEKEIS